MFSIKSKLNRKNLLILAATAAGALIILYAWRLPPLRNGIEATENAYVRATSRDRAQVDYCPRSCCRTSLSSKRADPGALDDRIYEQRVAQARSNHARRRRTSPTSCRPSSRVKPTSPQPKR